MGFIKTKAGTELPLLNLQGKNYLQVAWRIAWFREERPTWTIETSFKEHDDTRAIVQAIIKDDTGRIISMAHKREDAGHFKDFMEKAETGAIGRALALCGYGSQFSPEIEEGERLADAPIPKSAPQKLGQKTTVINDKQKNLLLYQANKNGWDQIMLSEYVKSVAGVDDISLIPWKAFNNILGHVSKVRPPGALDGDLPA